MAKQKPENVLAGKIKAKLEETYPGSLWFRVHGGPWQRSGISDLIGCVEGSFVAVEVKLPRGAYGLTRLQQLFLEKVVAAGGVGVVATSPEEAASLVEQGFAPDAPQAVLGI